jgi:hypothetical protein
VNDCPVKFIVIDRKDFESIVAELIAKIALPWLTVHAAALHSSLPSVSSCGGRCARGAVKQSLIIIGGHLGECDIGSRVTKKGQPAAPQATHAKRC